MMKKKKIAALIIICAVLVAGILFALFYSAANSKATPNEPKPQQPSEDEVVSSGADSTNEVVSSGADSTNGDANSPEDNSLILTGRILKVENGNAYVELTEDQTLGKIGDTVVAQLGSNDSFDITIGLIYEIACTKIAINDPLTVSVEGLQLLNTPLTEEEFISQVTYDTYLEGLWTKYTHEEYAAAFSEKLAYPGYLPEGYKQLDTMYVNTYGDRLMMVDQVWYNTEERVYFDLCQNFYDFTPTEFTCDPISFHPDDTAHCKDLGIYILNQGDYVGEVGVHMHMRVADYENAGFEEIFNSIEIAD